MENATNPPGLRIAQAVVLVLMLAVAVTASYVESRYPAVPKHIASSPTKP